MCGRGSSEVWLLALLWTRLMVPLFPGGGRRRSPQGRGSGGPPEPHLLLLGAFVPFGTCTEAFPGQVQASMACIALGFPSVGTSRAVLEGEGWQWEGLLRVLRARGTN